MRLTFFIKIVILLGFLVASQAFHFFNFIYCPFFIAFEFISYHNDELLYFPLNEVECLFNFFLFSKFAATCLDRLNKTL